MEIAVGAVLEGKVKSITNFGAFVTLPEGKTGLVHISEVSGAFVRDIRDHLTEGQSVRVRVLGIEPNGKISLSIRRVEEAPAKAAPRPAAPSRRPAAPRAATPAQPLSFEEKLKQFMSDADSKLSANRLYSDHKTKTRRR